MTVYTFVVFDNEDKPIEYGFRKTRATSLNGVDKFINKLNDDLFWKYPDAKSTLIRRNEFSLDSMTSQI